MSGILKPAVAAIGANGRVGAGIVAALLEAGSPVIGVARDHGRLMWLAMTHAHEPGLELIQGSVADDESAAELAVRLRDRRLRAFISGTVPLVCSHGAGAEVRSVTGITVFAGMLGVAAFGLLLTPVFYVTLRKLSNRPLVRHGESTLAVNGADAVHA